MNTKSFQKKYGPWAVVTGASDGIGRAIAIELAGLGLNLVLVARREDRLKQLADQLGKSALVETRLLVLDVSEANAARRLRDATQDLEIGLLAAVAGFGTSGSFLDNDLEAELNMLDVNCRAVVGQCHDFGRRFRSQRRGGIILFSSLFAFQGVPRAANYAATKAFIQSLGEALNIELKEYGIDVLVSAPGPVVSGFGSRADMKMRFGATPEQVAHGTLAQLGRSMTTRPGFISKFLEFSLKSTMSRWARIRILTQITRGMTEHQSHRASIPEKTGA